MKTLKNKKLDSVANWSLEHPFLATLIWMVLVFAGFAYAGWWQETHRPANWWCADTVSTETVSNLMATATPCEGLDGMYFNTRNVFETHWYGTVENGVYYVVYDDVDAGLTYEAIRVTENTYHKVLDAVDADEMIEGTLHIVHDYEATEYELEIDND